MGYAFVMSPCVACKRVISYNPMCVPSLTVNGQREPLCEACYNEWNRIHRTSKGLPPVPLNPLAYQPCHESELPS